jgi:hypothetical protein
VRKLGPSTVLRTGFDRLSPNGFSVNLFLRHYTSVLSQKFGEDVGAPCIVIPAKAGIQRSCYFLDSGSRPPCRLGRNDARKYATNFRNRTPGRRINESETGSGVWRCAGTRYFGVNPKSSDRKVVIANEVKQSRLIALRLPRTLRVLAMTGRIEWLQSLSLFRGEQLRLTTTPWCGVIVPCVGVRLF